MICLDKGHFLFCSKSTIVQSVFFSRNINPRCVCRFVPSSQEVHPSAPTQWQCMCDLLLRWSPSVVSQPSVCLHHSYAASERRLQTWFHCRCPLCRALFLRLMFGQGLKQESHDDTMVTGDLYSIKQGLDGTSLNSTQANRVGPRPLPSSPFADFLSHGGHCLRQWLINLSFLQGPAKIYHSLLFLLWLWSTSSSSVATRAATLFCDAPELIPGDSSTAARPRIGQFF